MGILSCSKEALMGQLGKLLQAGADVGARADECETALHLAASNGHHDVVRMLLNQVRGKRAWRYVYRLRG